MHNNCIAHTNLTCDHIIYNPSSKEIKLIGLGSSVKFEPDDERKSISQDDLQERDFHYISPEMGSTVKQYFDFRTDLYSLGVIFYKMLTGEYPMHSEDRMQLILLHLTQEALPLQYFDPTIPKVICQMISKLLSKKLDDRYQTAKGLVYDLDLIMSEYDSDKTLKDIVLGGNDIPSRLCLSNKLYDRDDDFNTLCSALKRVSSDCMEIVFVTGCSGTGA